VITLIRKLLKFVKKEQRFLSAYERSNPHFFWYLAIDALLTVAIILGGYYFFADDSTAQKLEHSGVVVMSSEELISHLKKENVDVFWLGPISGYEYTLNHEVPGIADLFYQPKSLGKHDIKSFLYEVKTYKSQEVWDAHTHTILSRVNTKMIAVNTDLSIRINPTSMKGVIATYRDKPEIVAIAYPTPQSLKAMIKNVESLKPVQ